jgi:hypothetical protein
MHEYSIGNPTKGNEYKLMADACREKRNFDL